MKESKFRSPIRAEPEKSGDAESRANWVAGPPKRALMFSHIKFLGGILTPVFVYSEAGFFVFENET